MSHGYSSVNLSSLTSMFPETGIYDSFDTDNSDATAWYQQPNDSVSAGDAQSASTLLSALQEQATSPKATAPNSGLFDLSEEMMFSMMSDASPDNYGADPMASFGNYNSFSPHWKTDGGGAISQDALLNKLAAGDQAAITRRKLQ